MEENEIEKARDFIQKRLDKNPATLSVGKFIIAILVMIVLSLVITSKCNGQDVYPVMYGGGGQVEELLPVKDLRNSAPSLWQYADNFEGADQYIVYKEAHQTEIGKKNHLYLVGLDSLGNETMKIQIDSVQLSRNLSYCIVTYNNWEIRLRGKLN